MLLLFPVVFALSSDVCCPHPPKKQSENESLKSRAEALANTNSGRSTANSLDETATDDNAVLRADCAPIHLPLVTK